MQKWFFSLIFDVLIFNILCLFDFSTHSRNAECIYNNDQKINIQSCIYMHVSLPWAGFYEGMIIHGPSISICQFFNFSVGLCLCLEINPSLFIHIYYINTHKIIHQLSHLKDWNREYLNIYRDMYFWMFYDF